MKRAAPPSILIAVMLLAFAVIAEPQQPTKVWRVGLSHVGLDHVPPSLEPLRQELKKLGYQEGKNILLDWRNLPDEEAALATAKQFVREGYDVIVAFENQTIRASKAATTQVPVVFLHATDPLADGFVTSMARPGGNLTGFFGIGDMPAKRLELFKEIVPKLRRILVPFDNKDPVTPRYLGEIRNTSGGLNCIWSSERQPFRTKLKKYLPRLNPATLTAFFPAPLI